MSRIDELKEIISEARAELSNLEADELANKNVHYIGKCFRYKNSYSCPKSEKDYWFSYTKFTHLEDGGYLRGFSFQEDCYGNVTIKKDISHVRPLDEHREITQAQFDKAYDKINKKLEKLA